MSTAIQPQDKSVTVDGLKLHYLDWGTTGKTPMLLLHGLRGHAHAWDDFSMARCQLSPDVAQKMVDAMPHATVVDIARAGHMVFEDNPDDFNRVIGEWLS